MKTHDFYYDLPEELIAQTPVEPRDHSRMLVVHRGDGKLEHKHFYDILDYLRPGDVLVAISTSGKSPNIVKALEAARAVGLGTVGLTGKGGGLMPPLCDHLFNVEHSLTPLIQEVHGALIHLFCRLVDWYLFENAAALREPATQGA